MPNNLQPFSDPKSVIIIGASGKPRKLGNDVVRDIIANGYKGLLYLVNPKGGEIEGIKVHQSIQELPDGIDLAIIILPAEANIQAIRECTQKVVRFYVLAAHRFSEVDESGQAIQDELKRLITETGIRVPGLNTFGHTSTPSNFTSSFFTLGRIR